MSFQPTPEESTIPESPKASGSPKRGTARSSISAELLDLFRATERPSLGPGLSPTHAPEPQPPAAAPSAFLRRYLEDRSRLTETVPTGLASLDDCLGGGLGPGLHVVVGPAGVGKTAFLESVAWEALSRARPVLYYALKEGAIGAWERMISTFAGLLGVADIDVKTLRSHRLNADALKSLTQLDLAFRSSVLPSLSFIDSLPASSDGVAALTSDIVSRAPEAEADHGALPLVLVDDLERLLSLASAEPLPRLLARLDTALTADSMAGLLVGITAVPSPVSREAFPVRTVFVLTSGAVHKDDRLVHVNLEIRQNSPGGWSGTLPLVLERRTGLFAQSWRR